jgi:hypothetical protein
VPPGHLRGSSRQAPSKAVNRPYDYLETADASKIPQNDGKVLRKGQRP